MNLQAWVAILKWVSQTFGLRHSPAVMSGRVFSSDLSVSSSPISSSQHMTVTSPDPHLAQRPAEPEPHPLGNPRHPPAWALLSGLSAVPVGLSLRAPGCPNHGAQEPYDLSHAASAIILLRVCLESQAGRCITLCLFILSENYPQRKTYSLF